MSNLNLFPRVPLERDNSEEFLKREARAAQLAEEIEASATYKARVALENDERTDEEKFTAVVRGERETHTLGRWCQDESFYKNTTCFCEYVLYTLCNYVNVIVFVNSGFIFERFSIFIAS